MTYKKISKHTFIILIFALSMVILAVFRCSFLIRDTLTLEVKENLKDVTAQNALAVLNNSFDNKKRNAQLFLDRRFLYFPDSDGIYCVFHCKTHIRNILFLSSSDRISGFSSLYSNCFERYFTLFILSSRSNFPRSAKSNTSA